jgi:histidine triad (HIT) family protein
MKNCEFCQIIKGRQPCYKVYEDENFLAFLDIYPQTKAHTLVIPKKHYQWVYDVPNFTEYWAAVLKVTRAIQKAFKPEFIRYMTYGIDVPHAHIHILPEGVVMTGGDLSEIAKRIYEEIKNG